MLELGLLAVNRVLELVAEDVLAIPSSPCSSGGDVAIENLDGDGSGGISAGDAIDLQFSSGCVEDVLLTGVSGGIGITVGEAFVGVSSDATLSGSFAFEPDFLVSLTDSGTGQVLEATVEGSLAFDVATFGASLEALTLSIPGSSDIVITVGTNLPEPVVERVTAFDLNRRVFPDNVATSRRVLSQGYSLDLESETLGGAVSCETEQPLVSLFDVSPTAGQLRCDGAADSSVRLITDPVSNLIGEIDPDGDGTYDELTFSVLTDWNSLTEGPLFEELLVDLPDPAATVAAQVGRTAIAMEVNDSVYSPFTDTIYVSNGAGIHELDPDTLDVLRTVAIANDPAALGLSDDGSTLWFGYTALNEMGSLTTADLQPGPGFSLGLFPPPGNVARYARDILVVPGTTDVLVVSTEPSDEVLAFDSGVQLPGRTLREAREIVFRDAATIVGTGATGLNSDAYKLSFDAVQGVETVARFPGLARGPDAELIGADGEYFTSTGLVFSIESPTLEGRLETPGPALRRVAPDSENGLVYAVTQQDSMLYVYDADTRTRIGQYEFEPAAFTNFADNLIKTDDSLVLMSDESVLRFALSDLAPNLPPIECAVLDLSDLLWDGQYTSIRCPVTGIEYDASRDLIFAGLAGVDGPNGNAVAIFDAGTLAPVTAQIPVGATPRRLRISADGQTLYAVLDESSMIAEIDLSALTLRRKIRMVDGDLAVDRAWTVAQSPLSDQDLLISGLSWTLSLYRSGTLQGAVADPFELYDDLYFDPDDPMIVYGHKSQRLATFTVDGTGVFEVSSVDDVLPGERVVLFDGVFYSSGGQDYDLGTSTPGAACSLGEFARAVVVDEIASTLYGMVVGNASDQIYQCDIATGTVGQPVLLPFFDKEDSYDANELRLISDDRLLYLNDGQVVIVTAPWPQ